MKIIGLTGGIGSGKSTVAKLFEAYGIPVYIADDEARNLMNSSKIIKKRLIALLGESSYTINGINKNYIAAQIFKNKELLHQINAIVHPKVKTHFKRWLKKQNAPYILKEAAIIFENNLQSQYDLIITVTADTETRINRVIKRDKSNREKVMAVIENQLPDAVKISKSDHVIYNNDLQQTKIQVDKIHSEILKNS